MKTALELTQQEFESSSTRTKQYLKWHTTFKRQFTAFLQSLGCVGIEISKPNHFDMSGFFMAPNGKEGQLWYFSIGDLRWDKGKMLIRTAKHYQDYTGGCNLYADLSSVGRFTKTFKNYVAVTVPEPPVDLTEQVAPEPPTSPTFDFSYELAKTIRAIRP